jgi:hypothetical protein
MKLGDNVRILEEHTKGNKTEKMIEKAQPLEEMIDSGVLTDYTSTTSGTDIGELQKITVISSEEELAKLKTSNAKKQKDQPEMNEEKTENQKTDEQEGAVVAG